MWPIRNVLKLRVCKRLVWVGGMLLFAALAGGCAANKLQTARRFASVANWGSGAGVALRKRPCNRFQETLTKFGCQMGYGGDALTLRTEMFLQRNLLLKEYRESPDQVILVLQGAFDRSPGLQVAQVLAELAYLEGKKASVAGDQKRAGQLYVTSTMAAYHFLLDTRFEHSRNSFDPLFRQMCDVYNAGLESMLRIMREQGTLRPGGTFEASSLDDKPVRFVIEVGGRRESESFEKFEFVSDFETRGLGNVHHSYGLGVPLIGIHSQFEGSLEERRYYPQGLTSALTAFFQVEHDSMAGGNTTSSEPIAVRNCVIRLIDPLEQKDVSFGEQTVPLESDISTPLAYFLNDPLLHTNWFATLALLDGDFAREFKGLYMLEPFDPNKIPVVMVHGFWSSPTIWTNMFNDLRADRTIRENYQFWFYMYPSGQPFWFSALQMRRDLARAREVLDVDHTAQSLDQMVLVGHSMGGLISRLQAVDSDDSIWGLLSERPVEELVGDATAISQLHETLFFKANPSVRRVVTMATPFQGSDCASLTNRWLGHQLFRLPSFLTKEYAELVRNNESVFQNSQLLKINTSIDSLSPESPFFEVMSGLKQRSGVKFHNISGVHEADGLAGWMGSSDEKSDGVVSLESAQGGNSDSEIIVSAEHSTIHRNPGSILEVHRILIEHLNELYGNERQNETNWLPVHYEQEQTKKETSLPTPVVPRKFSANRDFPASREGIVIPVRPGRRDKAAVPLTWDSEMGIPQIR